MSWVDRRERPVLSMLPERLISTPRSLCWPRPSAENNANSISFWFLKKQIPFGKCTGKRKNKKNKIKTQPLIGAAWIGELIASLPNISS